MNQHFEIYPKIIISDTSTTLTIKGISSADCFEDDQPVLIRHIPLRRYTTIGAYDDSQELKVYPRLGSVSFELFFKNQQEHKIEMIISKQETIEFRVYSVSKALWDLNPYKGDFHMHSLRSDGQETPVVVAAMCRKIGLDFMAITDHGQFKPSLEAKDFFKNLDLDLAIETGEEVHSLNNSVHIINYGGDFSVNEWMHNNQDTFNQTVALKELNLVEIYDNKSRFEIASSEVVFDKIREGHGLAIFCHPYWQVDSGYYISEIVNSYMMQHQPYDALEVIGGYHPFEEESNIIQIARYQEERAKGKFIPIVGVSDAHGCFNGLFGWFYTIVFAKSNCRDDVSEAVKLGNSVAIEAIPHESPRPVGSFELVMYSLFLIREIFPLHDKLCAEEGEWMLKFSEGNHQSIKELAQRKGNVEQFWNKVFGR